MKGVCCICGKAIESTGREAPIYCERHRQYAKRDSEILQNISLNNAFSIAAAIFQRARDDYILDVENQRSDAEWFLRSNWAQVLTNGELNAELTISELDRRIDGLKRIRSDPGTDQDQVIW